jgi:hypothetical protein
MLQLDVGRIPNVDDASIVVVTTSLSNSGAPSIADNWNLDVYFPTPTTSSVKGTMMQIPDAPFGGLARNGKPLQWNPTDSLYDKAMKAPLENGMKHNGVLLFRVPARKDDAMMRGVVYTLSCKDIDGNLISGQFVKGSGEDGHVTYLGMKSPPE